MEIASNILPINIQQEPTYKAFFRDYKSLIESLQIPFKLKASYIVIGDFGSNPEWLLYISVIKTQLAEALEIILPLVTTGEIAVALPENSQIHGSILDGGMGWHDVSKVIAISVQDNTRLSTISKKLIDCIDTLKGPEIPEAIKLGNCLYTEFGVASFADGPIRNNYYNENINWPFDHVSPPKPIRPSKWLTRKYLIIDTLKLDPKGNVYKAFNLAKWFNVKWCVVKEGRYNQCFDEFNRSIIERLNWQFFIQQEFSEDNILPQVIDFFVHRDNAYLVMEMISGVSYSEKVSEIQKGILYSRMPDRGKEKLLNLLSRLVGLIEKFHLKGYLHRDISPINFIVRENGDLVAIDVELAYNYSDNTPSPWFILGTDGYMSKGQISLQLPEIADDIYGLGGMLIRTLTGISPIKFERLRTTDQLHSHLAYFIDDKRIVSLILQCRDHIPSMRPGISSIKHTLELAQAKLLTIFKQPIKDYVPAFPINILVQNAIQGFYKKPLVGPDFLWYDIARNAPGQRKVFSFYPDLFNGASGVLYTCSQIDQSGISIDFGNNVIEANLEKVLLAAREAIANDNKVPGVIRNNIGIAMLIAQLIKAGQLENSITYVNLISRLISLGSDENSTLNSGLAGLGLAAMKIFRLLNFPGFETNSVNIVHELICRQLGNGGWYISQSEKNEKLVSHGLMSGVAGIAYFLLAFGHEFDHEPALISAKKALTYLEKHIISEGNITHIPENNRHREPNPWLENGFSGIAYLFIRAYEYEHTERYKQIAGRMLENHPLYVTSNYLGQANGITGVGEIYLEAFRVFKQDIWWDRAMQIGAFLAHSYCCTDDDGIYWLDGDDPLPTPGFMNGNAGILHFLARLNSPDKIDFPFFHV